MALEQFLLDIIACPETHQPLQVLDDATLGRLNAAVDKEKLKDRSGRVVSPRISAALVRSDGQVAYPVWDDVPRLLTEAAIELDQLA